MRYKRACAPKETLVAFSHNSAFSDVLLATEGIKVYAHKVVVAAHSAAMLQAGHLNSRLLKVFNAHSVWSTAAGFVQQVLASGSRALAAESSHEPASKYNVMHRYVRTEFMYVWQIYQWLTAVWNA